MQRTLDGGRVSDVPKNFSIEGKMVSYKDKSFDSKSEKVVYDALVKLLKRKNDSSIMTQLIIPENGLRRFDVFTLYGSFKTQRTLFVIEYDGPAHFNGKNHTNDNQKAYNLLKGYSSFLVRLECAPKEVESHLSKAITKMKELRSKQYGTPSFDISGKDFSSRIYFSNPDKYKWHIGHPNYDENKTVPDTDITQSLEPDQLNHKSYEDYIVNSNNGTPIQQHNKDLAIEDLNGKSFCQLCVLF